MLDEGTKVKVRAVLIQRGLATSTGDLERTQDSAANQFRRGGGGIQNFATSIGSVLMPAIQSGIGAFNELLASAIEVFERGKPMIESWVTKVVGAVEMASRIWRNFGDYSKIGWLQFLEVGANVLSFYETIPTNLSRLSSWLVTNWKAAMFDLYNSTRTMSENIDKNLGKLWTSLQDFFSGKGFHFEWTPMLDGFKATAAALPELLKTNLVSMDGEINKISRRIEAREALRAKGAAGLRPDKPMLAKEAKEKGEAELKGAAALEFGSSAAGSAIARHRNASGDDKAVVDTAKNTKDTTKILKETLAYMKNAKASGSAVSMAIASL